MPNEIKSKINLPDLVCESVPDPQPIKREPNNYSSLPSVVKSWNDYEDWITYDNSEFRADENFKECWNDVDNLKKRFGEIYLINLNSGDSVRKEKKASRYCFGFDLAIANTTPEDRIIMRHLIYRYRNLDGEFTTIKAIKQIVPAMQKIKSFPFVESHFS